MRRYKTPLFSSKRSHCRRRRLVSGDSFFSSSWVGGLPRNTYWIQRAILGSAPWHSFHATESIDGKFVVFGPSIIYATFFTTSGDAVTVSTAGDHCPSTRFSLRLIPWYWQSALMHLLGNTIGHCCQWVWISQGKDEGNSPWILVVLVHQICAASAIIQLHQHCSVQVGNECQNQMGLRWLTSDGHLG